MDTFYRLYKEILEDAHNINADAVDDLILLLERTKDNKLSELNHVDEKYVLPLNFEDRMDFIMMRPYQYHAVVQIKELYDELIKRAASVEAQNEYKRGES